MTENNHRTPARRLGLMAAVLVACGLGALWSMTLPWYRFAFEGTVVLPGTFEEFDQVTAAQDILGTQLASLELGSGPLQADMPVGPGGLLMPLVWVVVAVALGIATALVRSALFGLGGLVCTYLSHVSLGQVRAAMENPNYGGQYNTPTEGMWWFTMALFATGLMLVVMVVQTVLVNRRDKAQKRERGEEVPMSMLETISALKLTGLARIAGAALEEAGKAKDEAKEAKDLAKKK